MHDPNTGERPVEEQVVEEAAVDEGAASDEAAASDGAGEVQDHAQAEAEAAESVELDLEELQGRAAERDEYLRLAQRTQADFENYRRRMGREVASAEGRGMGRLARELLPALDNLGRALATLPEESDVAEGIRLVHAELVAALARVGIEGFDPKGEPFDPTQHEAMAQHPVEGAASGTVVEVYQPGYRLKDAVLRPARVVVAA
jgi:molecular chaperone GrpE